MRRMSRAHLQNIRDVRTLPAMPKPKSPARTTVYIAASEKKLIEALTKRIARDVKITPTRDDVIRLALHALAREQGLEQRTDVEPQDRAGDTVLPEASS